MLGCLRMSFISCCICSLYSSRTHVTNYLLLCEIASLVAAALPYSQTLFRHSRYPTHQLSTWRSGIDVRIVFGHRGFEPASKLTFDFQFAVKLPASGLLLLGPIAPFNRNRITYKFGKRIRRWGCIYLRFFRVPYFYVLVLL